MNKYKFGLFLMGYKGFVVLKSILAFDPEIISFVVLADDKSIEKDYFFELNELTKGYEFNVYKRQEIEYIKQETFDYLFAISWRWLIEENTNKLIVLHDSLLPEYRGFNPLVTALIEGDTRIGVTAIFANAEFDRGNIIGVKEMNITYPIKINEAIRRISDLYGQLVIQLISNLNYNKIIERPQDETIASYSLWRNEDDYFINWEWDADRIVRFIDAVGTPYNGAKTMCENKVIKISEAEEVPDMNIINRVPGKIIFYKEHCPVIVCGKGLLMIKNSFSDTNEIFVFKKLRLKLI